MRTIGIICRIVVGLVFMFSGTVKAIDPMGSAYKFTDYFQAFNLESLQPFALVLGIILCTTEFIAGFSLVSGYRLKYGIWGVVILMVIFTPLTLVLAITNPVSDCGCFGDALHLTNWQTFWKNILLSGMVIFIIVGRDKHFQILPPKKEWLVISLVTILFVGFCLLNLRYLQLFDFLPYKKGVNISESMKIPDGMPADKYSTTFIYEKDGITKEFSLENYPADDSSWIFIEQKSVLIEKGYTPPIHDFSITSKEGIDLTEDILEDKGYTLLIISTKLEKADKKKIEDGIELGRNLKSNGMSFYILTASGTDRISEYDSELPICNTDETTLKTIVRSNPGYVLLKEGRISGKWSWATVPASEKLLKEINEKNNGGIHNNRSILVVYSATLAIIIVLLLIFSGYYSSRRIPGKVR